MPPAPPVSLDTLNGLDRAPFLTLLANVYEHTPWGAERAWEKRPFASVRTLFATMREAVHAASPADRLALVRGHPELAVKPADGRALTQDSVAEQGSAGLDRLPEQEFAAFQRLNEAYRGRFGHPFILCVRRHTRDSILAAFERRLGNAPEAELATALAEIDRSAVK